MPCSGMTVRWLMTPAICLVYATCSVLIAIRLTQLVEVFSHWEL